MNSVGSPMSGRAQWTRRSFALALPLLAGAPQLALAAPAGAPAVARQSSELMGTRVDIAIPLAGAALQRDADAAMARAFAEMQRLEALMSRYRPDSEVARIGAAAGRAPVRVSPEVMAVLRTAQQLHRASAGAFDPTIGALQGWRFEPGAQAVPQAREIDRAGQPSGCMAWPWWPATWPMSTAGALPSWCRGRAQGPPGLRVTLRSAPCWWTPRGAASCQQAWRPV